MNDAVVFLLILYIPVWVGLVVALWVALKREKRCREYISVNGVDVKRVKP